MLDATQITDLEGVLFRFFENENYEQGTQEIKAEIDTIEKFKFAVEIAKQQYNPEDVAELINTILKFED